MPCRVCETRHPIIRVHADILLFSPAHSEQSLYTKSIPKLQALIPIEMGKTMSGWFREKASDVLVPSYSGSGSRLLQHPTIPIWVTECRFLPIGLVIYLRDCQSALLELRMSLRYIVCGEDNPLNRSGLHLRE